MTFRPKINKEVNRGEEETLLESQVMKNKYQVALPVAKEEEERKLEVGPSAHCALFVHSLTSPGSCMTKVNQSFLI